MDIHEETADIIISVLVIVHLTKIVNALRKRKRCFRRWAVRPINQNREKFGEQETLFQEMKKDPVYFFKYTRMNLKCFEKLLSKVTPLLIKRSNRKPLTPEHRLAITLRFLATGCDTFSLATSFRVGESTVRMIIQETCAAIIKVLAPKYLKPPTREDWLRYCRGFYSKWNIPNCFGAFDGKHITIKSPPNSGSLFFNYKKTYSIVLMAICDFEYKFTLVDIGSYGSANDGGIFEDCQLSAGLFNGELNLPEELIVLPNSNINMPCFLVGDDAFPLSVRLMKPYPGSYLDERKRIFNYRLSRARRMIENTFGILSSRWKIFYRPVAMDPEKMDKIVLTTICLHNMVMTENKVETSEEFMYCPPSYVDQEVQGGRVLLGDWRFNGEDQLLQFSPKPGRHTTQAAHKVRDVLSSYFLSPGGEVSWQYDYVRRGQNRDTF